MSAPKIIIVTGANRGIGHAIAKQIIARSDLGPLKLFATSRTGDFKLEHGKDQEVLYPRLEISDSSSVKSFCEEVKKHGQVSALINNAGVNLDNEYGLENARKTLDVNFRGSVKMCQTFLPHMSRQGRIVNLASVASSIQAYRSAIQERFRRAATLDDLEKLAEEFESSVRTSSEEAAGFGPPGRSYSVSKALLRAYTNIIAKQHPNLLINSCCPGWVSTDMGALVGSSKVKPPKSTEQGAQIPVRLAIDDIEGVTGQYWANDSVRSKELGKVQTEW